MEIFRIDPLDEAALSANHAAMSAGLAFGRVDPPIWSLDEVRVNLTHEGSSYQRELYSAVVDGEVVGGAQIEMPMRDNLNLAQVEVAVRPSSRRQGVGTALLEAVAARTASLGRTSLLGIVNQPVSDEPAAGVTFAARHGFTWRNTEIRRSLPLPVPPAHLAELEAKAAARAGEYRLVSWAGACPEEWVEQFAYLKSMLMTDAPTGEMDYEQEIWDAERVRADEAKTEAQGRKWVTTVAVAPDGTLAGNTQIGVPGHESRTFQWDTLVLEVHRGHRLGLALKVANLRRLAEVAPGATSVETWNAEQNGPMVAVNEEIGFRVVEGLQEWQRG
ncbi:GNAT family N-acetyltransferase [Actinorhabdospora filicis]|uniref:GNAT family N-acetyltransferase n=1 Tax=Actinorhabdospora filicis TaxID=1785913 RepID=A0A9W6W7M7_9ACTN|nr:GNAT family N-acetyltransferase [Actinorhabdospora filicis]GLZ76103.1 GNAT family N-acetyltransferase [Actinorhabdospora filicis]